tara:strand:+ start:198 stop:860 length:663 start_codon:yes stop_codon:yes gene_type:complete
MKNNISQFEKIIKIKFSNKLLLQQALTHKSANQNINNEKLEFLGDRVIGLVLSGILYDLYPNENEGVLDKRFAKLVNRKTCAKISWLKGLHNFIYVGNQKKNISIKDEKILSDLCEAVIGAVYLDKGFDYVKNLVINFWKNEIKQSDITVLDSKTELQEYSLKLYKKLPVYKLLNTKGPKHNPIFKISVSITGLKGFIGSGNSKQEAEQNAAKKILKELE